MDDSRLLHEIGRFVAEEHELERPHDGHPTDADRRRLEEIALALDQCWDLLRQRRAKRGAGADPNEAAVRPTATVEGYVQ